MNSSTPPATKILPYKRTSDSTTEDQILTKYNDVNDDTKETKYDNNDNNNDNNNGDNIDNNNDDNNKAELYFTNLTSELKDVYTKDQRENYLNYDKCYSSSIEDPFGLLDNLKRESSIIILPYISEHNKLALTDKSNALTVTTDARKRLNAFMISISDERFANVYYENKNKKKRNYTSIDEFDIDKFNYYKMPILRKMTLQLDGVYISNAKEAYNYLKKATKEILDSGFIVSHSDLMTNLLAHIMKEEFKNKFEVPCKRTLDQKRLFVNNEYTENEHGTKCKDDKPNRIVFSNLDILQLTFNGTELKYVAVRRIHNGYRSDVDTKISEKDKKAFRTYFIMRHCPGCHNITKGFTNNVIKARSNLLGTSSSVASLATCLPETVPLLKSAKRDLLDLYNTYNAIKFYASIVFRAILTAGLLEKIIVQERDEVEEALNAAKVEDAAGAVADLLAEQEATLDAASPTGKPASPTGSTAATDVVDEATPSRERSPSPSSPSASPTAAPSASPSASPSTAPSPPSRERSPSPSSPKGGRKSKKSKKPKKATRRRRKIPARLTRNQNKNKNKNKKTRVRNR
jgi:hypothetical protein